jgi:hypothetical protein
MKVIITSRIMDYVVMYSMSNYYVENNGLCSYVFHVIALVLMFLKLNLHSYEIFN